MYDIEDLTRLREEISDYMYSRIYYSSSNDEIQQKMSYFYKALKSIFPSFSFKDNNFYYKHALIILRELESNYLPIRYIITTDDLFFRDIDILSKIVKKTIVLLLEDHKRHKIDFKRFDFTNRCYEASQLVKDICDEYNIECKIIRIDPAFSKEANILEGSGFHYFNIVTIKNKKYIVDCSYRQFFLLRYNNIDRIGVPDLVGCNPGFYMMQDEERKTTAQMLINNGWIEATDENVKNYFDGFSMSYRNGLYYERLGKMVFETTYTAKDYWNFINGKDNQLNHEDKETLGKLKIHIK